MLALPPDDAEMRSRLDLLDDIRNGVTDAAGNIIADLGTCPYFARFMQLSGHNPGGACSFGCTGGEPRCVREMPAEGWPSHPFVKP